MKFFLNLYFEMELITLLEQLEKQYPHALIC